MLVTSASRAARTASTWLSSESADALPAASASAWVVAPPAPAATTSTSPDMPGWISHAKMYEPTVGKVTVAVEPFQMMPVLTKPLPS